MQFTQDVIQFWAGSVCIAVVLLVMSIALAWFLSDVAHASMRHLLQIVQISVARYWLNRLQKEGVIAVSKQYRELVAARNPQSPAEFYELDSHCFAAEWAAHNTLEQMGYTYSGGALWKPPLGQAPDFNLIDDLHARIEQLAKDREEWRESCLMANDNAAAELRRRHEMQEQRDTLKAENERLKREKSEDAELWRASITEREQRINALQAENERLAKELDAAQEEINCAESALEAFSCEFEAEVFNQGFDCLGDFVQALWKASNGQRDALQAKLDAMDTGEPVALEDEMLDAAISWCDSNGINVLEPEQLSSLVNSLYITVRDAAPKALAPLERVAECAARLVEHADFQLGGILSADSKAKDIPSKAVSQVKSRHLAALRDSLAAHGIGGTP